MSKDRRGFVKDMVLIGAGMAMLPSCSIFAKSDMSLSGLNIPGIENFGLQLYTLRDDLPKDPKAVLKTVASYGYKEIEGYEGGMGLWWGMKNNELKQYLDSLGMKMVSSHCDINKDFDRKAGEAAEVGLKYLIAPWLGPQKSIDDFKVFAEKFNEKGAICKKNGIRFAYHNHDYSFKKVDGLFPQDIMVEMTDPTLVDFEMDMYWVHAAGQDIETWLKKYKGRFKLCHIKDYSKQPGEDNGKNSVDLGRGVIDWPKVLKTAHECGMEHYIVEQEAYPFGSPLEAVKADADFMKKMTK